MTAPDWPCEAYGPDGLALGLLCFRAHQGARKCPDQGTCTAMLDAERNRLWEHIVDGAAHGDPTLTFLRRHIDGPAELLGGARDPARAPRTSD